MSLRIAIRESLKELETPRLGSAASAAAKSSPPVADEGIDSRRKRTESASSYNDKNDTAATARVTDWVYIQPFPTTSQVVIDAISDRPAASISRKRKRIANAATSTISSTKKAKASEKAPFGTASDSACSEPRSSVSVVPSCGATPPPLDEQSFTKRPFAVGTPTVADLSSRDVAGIERLACDLVQPSVEDTTAVLQLNDADSDTSSLTEFEEEDEAGDLTEHAFANRIAMTAQSVAGEEAEMTSEQAPSSTGDGRESMDSDYETCQKSQKRNIGAATSTLRRRRQPERNLSSMSKVVKLRLRCILDEILEGSTSRRRTVSQWGLLSPPSSRTSDAEPSFLLDIDPDMLDLSKSMTSRVPVATKPEPMGEPLVWADSRQALCETVPYFKKPQGGCHHNDKHVYAFLFDGVGHCREYMDSDVIIARAGGGMECDANGQMVQKKHQSMDEAQVQSVQNDIVLQNPFIIICGDKNTGALTKMPHRYCVLGWYKPIDVWAEKTAGKGHRAWTTIKYRLERLDSGKPAWHAPKNEVAHSHQDKAGQIEHGICTFCHRKFPKVYLCGWMCLNADCMRFWQVEGREVPCGALAYDPAFLLHRHPWADETEPYSVRPSLPDVGKVLGDHVRYINTRGVVCPQCGRCNSRYLFSHWRCDGPSCSWTLRPQHAPIEPAALHSPWETHGDGPALARNKHDGNVRVTVDYVCGYKVYTYTFDGIEGSFVHAVANNKINREPGGPNDMLRELQTADMGLERRRFGGEKMSFSKEGPTEIEKSPALMDSASLLTPQLKDNPKTSEAADAQEARTAAKKPEADEGDFMTAFSMNYGLPYKFVASGASRPFEDAPEAVRACRSRLNWAARTFLARCSAEHDFNEELIFAYMEGQKIEYHDDGEDGLGPRIATLSLGGKAKMHMRMKAKHYVGCSKTGVFTAEEPKPGCLGGREMFEQRHARWEELRQLKGHDRAAFRKRQVEIPKELGIYDTRNKKADDLVTITLSHGDIVLMEGYEVQKYLEHKVMPEEHLRFALTCREVLANHLTESELPRYTVGRDEYGYDGSRAQDWA